MNNIYISRINNTLQKTQQPFGEPGDKPKGQPASMDSRTLRLSPFISCFLLSIPGFALVLNSFWLSRVNSIIPEPYLDEFFHVGQAQTYWKHQWLQWDPKITTPPGLYLWSYLICTGLWAICGAPVHLSAAELRSSSSVTLFNILPFRVWKLLSHIRDGEGERPLDTLEDVGADGTLAAWDSALTVLNICLFPPLFFFSGLYYTDLPALFLVLEAYINDIARSRDHGYGGSRDGGSDASAVSRHSSRQPNLAGLVWWWRYARFVVPGLLALLCRQTNIFWVAVFLGGVRVVRTLHQISNVDSGSTSTTVKGIATRSWGHGQIYDPPVSEACIEGE